MSIADKITPRQREFIMLFSLAATTMVSIDMTIANVALPEIQGGLGIAPDQLGWVLTSYLIASAVGTPLTGALVPKFGLRSLYILSVAGFGLSSLACGVATSVPELVSFRAAQGFAGSALPPLGLMLLYDVYPRERLGRAIALYSMGSMSGIVIGPTLGGFITDVLSWRWIFLVNVPLAIVAVMGLLSTMPKIPRTESRPFDYFGFGLLALGLICFQLFLDRGEGKGWFESREIVMEFALALAALYMFIVHCVTAKDAFLDLTIFKDRNFVPATIITSVIAMVSLMPSLITPLFLQQVQGFDVLDTGVLLTPRGLAMIGSMFVLSRVVDRVDTRLVVIVGVAFYVVGFFGMRFMTPDWPSGLLIWTGIITAVGGSLTTLPLNLVAFSTLPLHLRPMGASLFNLFRGMGSSVGTALMMGYIAHSTENNHVRMLEQISVYNPVMSGPGMPEAWSIADPLSLKLLSLEVWRQATVIAYNNAFTLGCIALVIGLPLLLMVRLPKKNLAAAEEENVDVLEVLEPVHV
jgi:MFS transporter, DHA2 family, multidrug resistance protein